MRNALLAISLTMATAVEPAAVQQADQSVLVARAQEVVDETVVRDIAAWITR
jgi:hypothetical protein